MLFSLLIKVGQALATVAGMLAEVKVAAVGNTSGGLKQRHKHLTSLRGGTDEAISAKLVKSCLAKHWTHNTALKNEIASLRSQ